MSKAFIWTLCALAVGLETYDPQRCVPVSHCMCKPTASAQYRQNRAFLLGGTQRNAT